MSCFTFVVVFSSIGLVYRITMPFSAVAAELLLHIYHFKFGMRAVLMCCHWQGVLFWGRVHTCKRLLIILGSWRMSL